MAIRESINEIKILIESLFKNEQGNLNLIGKLSRIIIFFIIIRIICRIANKIIDKSLESRVKDRLFIGPKRAKTLGNVLKKVISWTLTFIWIVNSLELFEVNTTSILATAGIGGLAIGFGAQSLVKDIITGFFIIFENQYSVGDYIEMNNYEGTVEDLGLRVTKIRAVSGDLHIIPNSNIQMVTNKTRGTMRALVEVPISYEEDIDKTIRILEKAFEELANNNENIVEGPTVLGVSNLSKDSVDIRVVAQTKAMEQWEIERQIRKRVKEALEEANIEIPYPKTVIIGDDGNDTKV